MYIHSLKYGIAAGIASGSMMVIAFYTGIPTRGNSYLIFMNLFFFYFSSFLSIYMVRKSQEGEISFKNALRIGISASLLTSIVFALFTAVYYYFLNPNFAIKYLVDIEISLKTTGVTGLELKKQMAEWVEDMSARNQSIKTLFSTSILTIILAAINSLILCKKD